MVKEWKISRLEQDELAMLSHQHAARAYQEGFYDDLVTPLHGLKRDGILRPDTNLEKLAKLKNAFDFTAAGTLTAGNSTPLTDGASAVLFASEARLQQEALQPLARWVDAEVAAVDYVHGDGLS